MDFIIKVQSSEKTIGEIISCQFPGKLCAPGETIRFPLSVKNPLGVKLQFRLNVKFFPSNWTVFVRNVGGEAVTIVTLEGGESVNLNVEVSVPAGESEGEYEIIFGASSSAVSRDLTLFVVVEEKLEGKPVIDLRAIPPYLDAYAGSQATFKVRLENEGEDDQLFDLAVSGLPPDLRTWFEGSDKQEMTRVYVEAGGSKEFYVVVSTPKGARLGAYPFVVSVASTSINRTVSLTLNILGLYEIKVTNVNFYTSLNVGGQGTFSLTVRNDGSQDVTNVKVGVTGTVPDGFTVSLEPTSVYSLKVDETVTFTITVKTESSVNAGNYYINFNTWSDQTEAQSFTLRVEVVQEMSWTIYGGVLIVIAVIGLFLVYRRFGRR